MRRQEEARLSAWVTTIDRNERSGTWSAGVSNSVSEQVCALICRFVRAGAGADTSFTITIVCVALAWCRQPVLGCYIVSQLHLAPTCSWICYYRYQHTVDVHCLSKGKRQPRPVCAVDGTLSNGAALARNSYWQSFGSLPCNIAGQEGATLLARLERHPHRTTPSNSSLDVVHLTRSLQHSFTDPFFCDASLTAINLRYRPSHRPRLPAKSQLHLHLHINSISINDLSGQLLPAIGSCLR